MTECLAEHPRTREPAAPEWKAASLPIIKGICGRPAFYKWMRTVFWQLRMRQPFIAGSERERLTDNDVSFATPDASRFALAVCHDQAISGCQGRFIAGRDSGKDATIVEPLPS